MIANCPQEFFVIHGIHIDPAFLTGNQDVFHILFNRDEGAGFNVIIAMILDKVLDCLACRRAKLDFIKDDDGIPLNQVYMIKKLKLKEEIIQIGNILKQILDAFRGNGEVNQNIAHIFVLCKRLYNRGLADTARALDQKRRVAIGFGLPLKELVINLTFEHSAHSYIRKMFLTILPQNCRIYNVIIPQNC